MATNEPTSERLFKRRKVIKPRVRRDSESASERDEQGTAQQRQSVRTRRTGVGFSASTSQPPITEATEYETAVSAESAVSAVDSYAARFARPTGQTGSKNQDEDKHMLAFIESKLSNHNADNRNLNPLASHTSDSTAITGHTSQKTGVSTIAGTLQEVDLGPDATQRNVQRTQAATHRLEGGQIVDASSNARQRKPRLGRDGKPLRPRKRRGSEDLARDALVESLLQEHRVDVFAPTGNANANSLQGINNHEGAADERMAEEFKRDYMEQMSERNRLPPKKPPMKGEDKTKGPKMGGTRNTRAAQNAQSDKK